MEQSFVSRQVYKIACWWWVQTILDVLPFFFLYSPRCAGCWTRIVETVETVRDFLSEVRQQKILNWWSPFTTDLYFTDFYWFGCCSIVCHRRKNCLSLPNAEAASNPMGILGLLVYRKTILNHEREFNTKGAKEKERKLFLLELKC